MVRKFLLVLFLKIPSAICNQRFDAVYLSICFVIIGGDRFRTEFRRQQKLNPASQDTEKNFAMTLKEWNLLYVVLGAKYISAFVIIANRRVFRLN